jgi:hypothetical protein
MGRRQSKETKMDGQERPQRITRFKRQIAAAGLVGTGLVAGAVLGGLRIAGAQSSTPTPTAPSDARNHDPLDPNHGAAGETALTGTTAAKVKAAALKAVPGATAIRVETDSEGAVYEAHMRKADGSFVTVKFDKNFKVTEIIDGFGMGGHHDRSGSNSTQNSSSQTSASA